MILDWLKARALPYLIVACLAAAAYAGLAQWRLSACQARYDALASTVQTLTDAAAAAKARADKAVASSKAKVDEAERRARQAEQALRDRVHKDESCEDGVAAALEYWRSRP